MLKFSTFLLSLFLVLSPNFGLVSAKAQNTSEKTESAEAAEPDPGALKLADSNSVFAFDLYSRLKSQDGNLFFSPLSVSAVMAMLEIGAAGDTENQIRQTLRFEEKGEALGTLFSLLTKALTSVEKDSKLNLANSLWPQRDYKLKEDYLNQIKKYFGPNVIEVDYKKDEAGARKQINDWVSEHTEKKIENLLAHPLAPAPNLILVNAVYFKGQWKHPFEASQTYDGDFTVTPDKKVKAKFMTNTTRQYYLETQDAQIVELPYAGKSLVLLAALPKNPAEPLKTLEDKLTRALLDQWLEGLEPRDVEVHLPKFTFSWGVVSLKPVLEALGLKEIFTKKADLSLLTQSPGLYVSDILQKAFVEVNERSTEAAAATAGIMTTKAMAPSQVPPVFKADRPFVFLIFDKFSGSVIFMGRLSQP